jgi:hypothetical protein
MDKDLSVGTPAQQSRVDRIDAHVLEQTGVPSATVFLIG